MLAEKLGMTVFKLLTGKDAPLSGTEYNYWLCYIRLKNELEAAAQKAANKKSKASPAEQPVRKTLGG